MTSITVSIIPLEGTPDFWEAPKGLGHGDAQQAKLSQLAEEGPDCYYYITINYEYYYFITIILQLYCYYITTRLLLYYYYITIILLLC